MIMPEWPTENSIVIFKYEVRLGFLAGEPLPIMHHGRNNVLAIPMTGL